MKVIERNRFIKRMYKGNKINFIILLFTSIIEVVINLAISVSLQQMIDIANGTDVNRFYRAGIFLVIIVLCIVINIIINAIVRPIYRKKGMMQYKKYVFENILDKNVSAFNEHETSEYISALTNDVNYIEEHYFAKIFDLITNSLLFVGTLVLMFLYNYQLAIIGIIFSLLPLIIAICFGKKLSVYEKKLSDTNAKFMHYVKDSLIGFSTIKSFKAEDKINEIFTIQDQTLENVKVKRARIGWIVQGLGGVTSVVAQFGVFFVGGYLCIVEGSITPGIIIGFVQLMNYVVNPLSTIPQLLSKRAAAIPLIDKIARLVEVKTEENKQSVKFENSIKLEGLNFSYGEKVVLENINFDFQKGKSYVVVGASGSGKSTLLNLLMGRRKEYMGKIYYDNDELKEISSDSLINLVSLVEQNVFVFDDTIINNITMFSKVDEKILRDIIEKSGLKKLVEEKGENYRCGEGGSNLSGGEKQRISIARALLKKSQILLMDEATSSLDNETSSLITKEILALDDITKIVVTHKLDEETLSKFDQIITLKDGRILEVGTFTELLDKNGLFSFLYLLGK